jgi:hypothetical protein
MVCVERGGETEGISAMYQATKSKKSQSVFDGTILN